jgi:hypothetical protein
MKCRVLCRVPYTVTPDPHPRAHRSKRFRGSRQRLKRTTLRGNTSWQFWLLLVWVGFLLLVVVPWMMRHAPPH